MKTITLLLAVAGLLLLPSCQTPPPDDLDRLIQSEYQLQQAKTLSAARYYQAR